MKRLLVMRSSLMAVLACGIFLIARGAWIAATRDLRWGLYCGFCGAWLVSHAFHEWT